VICCAVLGRLKEQKFKRRRVALENKHHAQQRGWRQGFAAAGGSQNQSPAAASPASVSIHNSMALPPSPPEHSLIAPHMVVANPPAGWSHAVGQPRRLSVEQPRRLFPGETPSYKMYQDLANRVIGLNEDKNMMMFMWQTQQMQLVHNRNRQSF
jgi:hypothetical protein